MKWPGSRQVVPDFLKKVPSILGTFCDKKYKIDGVLFIPPTVKPETQLMKELEKSLRLPVRTLAVTKVKTQVAVPQKTLSRLDDRVENAARTIVVENAGL